jgi:hypothetical protein
MRKKIAKRLNLHRETLLQLGDTPLGKVAGAINTQNSCAAQCCSTCNASKSCPPPPTGNNEITCLC